MSPTLRRSAASAPATRTATRCTELKASARRPISSLERTSIGAGRLGLQVDLLAVLEPLDDAGQPALGRLLGRPLQPAHGPDQGAGGDQDQHHGQPQGGGQQQAVQPGPAVGGQLDGGAGGDHVAAEALLDRAHPVQLDGHGPEPGLRVDVQPFVAGALQGLLDERARPCPTSVPATVSSKYSCWATVALESNSAV